MKDEEFKEIVQAVRDGKVMLVVQPWNRISEDCAIAAVRDNVVLTRLVNDLSKNVKKLRKEVRGIQSNVSEK